MAFIPKGAAWYIAQVVLEITIEGEAGNIVHINYLLVRAESPEDAYEKALHLGAEHGMTYRNGEGKNVRTVFRGLRNLTVIYDPLDHGAELLYDEKVSVSQESMDTLIQSKQSLGVFKPIQGSRGPDYGSEEVRREARRLVDSAGPGRH